MRHIEFAPMKTFGVGPVSSQGNRAVAEFEGGRLIRRVLLFLFLLSILSPSLRSQESIRHQLNDLVVLEKDGHYEQIIRSVHALIDANDLGGEAGRAWTILGFAYEQLGHYQRSRGAYEQALQILEKNAPHSIE